MDGIPEIIAKDANSPDPRRRHRAEGWIMLLKTRPDPGPVIRERLESSSEVILSAPPGSMLPFFAIASLALKGPVFTKALEKFFSACFQNWHAALQAGKSINLLPPLEARGSCLILAGYLENGSFLPHQFFQRISREECALELRRYREGKRHLPVKHLVDLLKTSSADEIAKMLLEDLASAPAESEPLPLNDEGEWRPEESPPEEESPVELKLSEWASPFGCLAERLSQMRFTNRKMQERLALVSDAFLKSVNPAREENRITQAMYEELVAVTGRRNYISWIFRAQLFNYCLRSANTFYLMPGEQPLKGVNFKDASHYERQFEECSEMVLNQSDLSEVLKRIHAAKTYIAPPPPRQSTKRIPLTKYQRLVLSLLDGSLDLAEILQREWLRQQNR